MVCSSAWLPLLLLAGLCASSHVLASFVVTEDFEVQAADVIGTVPYTARFTHTAKYYYSTDSTTLGPNQAAVGYVACKRGTYQPSNGDDQCKPCDAGFVSASGMVSADACSGNADDSAWSGSLTNMWPFVSVGIDRSGMSYPAVFNYYQQFVSLPYQATLGQYNVDADELANSAPYSIDPHAYSPESPSVNPTYVISHDSVDIHLEATGMWGETKKRAYLDVGACAPFETDGNDPPTQLGYATSYTAGLANDATYAECLISNHVIEPAKIALQYQISYNGKRGQIVTQVPVSHTDLKIFLKDLKEGLYALNVWAVLKKGTGLFINDVTGANYTMPADVKTPYPTEFTWVVKRSKNTAALSATDKCIVVPGPNELVTMTRTSPFYVDDANVLAKLQKPSNAKASFCQFAYLDKDGKADAQYSSWTPYSDVCKLAFTPRQGSGPGVSKSASEYSGFGMFKTFWADENKTPGSVNMRVVDVLASDSRQQFALPPGCQSSQVVSQLKAFYKTTGSGSQDSLSADALGPSEGLLSDTDVWGPGPKTAGDNMGTYSVRLLYDNPAEADKMITYSCVGGKYTQARAANTPRPGIYPLTNVFGRIQLVGAAAMPIIYPTFKATPDGRALHNDEFYVPVESDVLTFDAWMAKYGGTAGLGLIEVTPCWNCWKVKTSIANFLTMAPPIFGFWVASQDDYTGIANNPRDTTDPLSSAITQIDEAVSAPLKMIYDGKFVPAAEFDFPAIVLDATSENAGAGMEHIGAANTFTARFSCLDKFGSTVIAGTNDKCTFFCSMDGKAWYDANNKNATHGEFACTSPLVVKPVSTGASTLTIRAVDSCGVAGPVKTLRIAADHTPPAVLFQGIPARQKAFPGQEDVLRNKHMDYCMEPGKSGVTGDETCKVRGVDTDLPNPDSVASGTDKEYKYYDICKAPDAEGRDDYLSIVVINYREEEGLDAGMFNSSSMDFSAYAIQDPDGTSKNSALLLAGMDKAASLTIKTASGVVDIGNDLSSYLDVDAYHTLTETETTANSMAAYKDNSLDISISSGRAEYDTVISGNISIMVDPYTPDYTTDCAAVLGMRMVNGKYHFGVLSYTNCQKVTLKFQVFNSEYAAFCEEGKALGMACGQGEGYYTTNLPLPSKNVRNTAAAWAARGFTVATVRRHDLPDADLIIECTDRFSDGIP